MKLKGVKGGKNSLIVHKKFKNKTPSKKTYATKSSKKNSINRKSLETFSSTPLQTLPPVPLKSNFLVKSLKQNKKLVEVAPNSLEISGTKEKTSRNSTAKTVNTLNENTIKHVLKKEYQINAADIKNAIVGVLKARETNPKLQQILFEERSPVFLHITCHKVPKGHSKLFRIPLKHSVLTEEDEICLIVPEVKGTNNKEHDKHIEFYENLLRTKDVTNIKKIMTCHEFRTEYETFEQKRRLADLYDIFLVDGRISGKIVGKCGKIFYKKRKVPTSIKLQATQLKTHIENTLSKVILNLHLKSNGYTVQFGHTKMNKKNLVENVYSVMDFLNEKFPMKLKNIKGVHIFAPRATSIPIYMSMKFPEDLKTPILKSKKPKAYKTFTDELTTLPNARVTVKPTGEVKVHRISKEDAVETADDRITDEDIIKGNKENDKDQDQDKNHKDSLKTKKVKVEKTKTTDKDVVKKTKKVDIDIQNEQKVMKKYKKKVIKIEKDKLNVEKENEQKGMKNKKRRINETSNVVEKELPVAKRIKKDGKVKLNKNRYSLKTKKVKVEKTKTTDKGVDVKKAQKVDIDIQNEQKVMKKYKKKIEKDKVNVEKENEQKGMKNKKRYISETSNMVEKELPVVKRIKKVGKVKLKKNRYFNN